MTHYGVGEQRLVVLCERLIAATAARQVGWELEGEDLFLWDAGDAAVTVTSRDEDGEPPYELAIYNGDRAKVEELASDLVDDVPAPWNEALAELYRIARRSALRADDIVDALIAGLPAGEGSDEATDEASRGVS